MSWKVCIIACDTTCDAYTLFLNPLNDVLGSALDALPIMMSLLDSRPDGFDSIEEAIQWQ